jgi:hypothetical protein
MTNIQKICVALLAATLLVGCDSAQKPAETDPLTLVKEWVAGNYNNIAQAEADAAADLPPELMHRPMHQLFAPVDVPGIEGHIVYQQSSMDGSENPAMIFRHGLMQYIPDAATDSLRQRELYFKDPESFKNAHLNPEILTNISLEDLNWDEGCDFYLTTSDDATVVSGPLIEGACVMFNEGLQKNLYADDLVEITATDYRFRGRYVDETGAVMWGTGSSELNSLTRQ